MKEQSKEKVFTGAYTITAIIQTVLHYLGIASLFFAVLAFVFGNTQRGWQLLLGGVIWFVIKFVLGLFFLGGAGLAMKKDSENKDNDGRDEVVSESDMIVVNSVIEKIGKEQTRDIKTHPVTLTNNKDWEKIESKICRAFSIEPFIDKERESKNYGYVNFYCRNQQRLFKGAIFSEIDWMNINEALNCEEYKNGNEVLFFWTSTRYQDGKKKGLNEPKMLIGISKPNSFLLFSHYVPNKQMPMEIARYVSSIRNWRPSGV
jgi:hypothetical protein